MTLAYFLYARKSSETEDRQVLSIDSQLNELRQLAKSRGLNIIEEFREAKSAKAPGRPIFTEMLKCVAKGKARGIVCWKLDRLARNPVDGGALIWSIDQKQLCEIVTPFRTFAKSGDDAFWMQLEFGMAKKYVDDLSDNVKRGMRARALSGTPPYGMLPIGYIRDPKTGAVIPDPERFHIVKRILQEVFREQYRPKEILHLATHAWGLRTPQCRRYGGDPLTVSSFYRMLANSFYTGVFRFGNEVYAGNYPAMIDLEQFRKIQRILGRSDNPRPKADKEFTYRGLIWCGGCGKRMTAEEKTNRFGSHYVYYHCARTVQAKTPCREPSVEESWFESRMQEWLERITLPPNVCDTALEFLHDLKDENETLRAQVKQNRERTLRNVEKQLKNLTHLRVMDNIGDNEYLGERERLLAQQRELEKAATNENEGDEVIELAERFFSFARLAKKRFEEGDKILKRQILLATLSHLSIKGRKLVVQAKKPFQLLLERSMSRNAWAMRNDVRTLLTAEDAREDLRGLPELISR